MGGEMVGECGRRKWRIMEGKSIDVHIGALFQISLGECRIFLIWETGKLLSKTSRIQDCKENPTRNRPTPYSLV
jgi:hypothetical protein